VVLACAASRRSVTGNANFDATRGSVVEKVEKVD
jgi:hypothetical protein